MTPLALIALAGSLVSAAAYIPQILHLLRQHCVCGLSLKAWFAWLITTLLIVPHAVETEDTIFLVIQLMNALAIAFIFGFAFQHRNRLCRQHATSHQPPPGVSAG